MTMDRLAPMIDPMELSSTLTWLVDEADASPGADRFLAELGAHLIEDGVPLAGGALTLAVPHPIIARSTWLWRAETGAVMKSLGFASAGFAMTRGLLNPSGDAGRDWLARILRRARCRKMRSDRGRTGLCSVGIGPRPFTAGRGRPVRGARFASAPLAALRLARH